MAKAIAAFLVWVVAKMIRARQERIDEKCNELVVYTASELTTVENIVSAQHGVRTVHEMVKKANVSVLKLWSIFISKARKVFIMHAILQFTVNYFPKSIEVIVKRCSMQIQ